MGTHFFEYCLDAICGQWKSISQKSLIQTKDPSTIIWINQNWFTRIVFVLFSLYFCQGMMAFLI